MPYVICSDCHLTTYSAALWSGTDECPSCGRELPVPRPSSGTTDRAPGRLVAAETPEQGASAPPLL